MTINIVPCPTTSRSSRLQRKQSVIARTQSRRKSQVERASSLSTLPNARHRSNMDSESELEEGPKTFMVDCLQVSTRKDNAGSLFGSFRDSSSERGAPLFQDTLAVPVPRKYLNSYSFHDLHCSNTS